MITLSRTPLKFCKFTNYFCSQTVIDSPDLKEPKPYVRPKLNIRELSARYTVEKERALQAANKKEEKRRNLEEQKELDKMREDNKNADDEEGEDNNKEENKTNLDDKGESNNKTSNKTNILIIGKDEKKVRKGKKEKPVVEVYIPTREENIAKLKSEITSKNIWRSVSTLHIFLDYVKDRLIVKKPDDWYRVSPKQIIAINGSLSLDKYGHLCHMLRVIYPNINWKLENFHLKRKRRLRQWIFDLMTELLPPGTQIIKGYRSEPDNLLFDCFVPEYNLVLDYQGVEHFHPEFSFIGSSTAFSIYSQINELKKEYCLKHSLKHIVIPYWWNEIPDSLVATLKNTIPNISLNSGLFEEFTNPIPRPPFILEKSENYRHHHLWTPGDFKSFETSFIWE